MKKEYKDFYRFLWEYLEDGNSAIVIKPRQVGMTSFAARYAAWCLDYKEMSVKFMACNQHMTTHMLGLVNGFRSIRVTGEIDPPNPDKEELRIFDEVDFMYEERLRRNLEGTQIDQFLAYTSIKDMKSLCIFREQAVWRLKREKGKEFHVFDISNVTENKYYEETFRWKH